MIIVLPGADFSQNNIGQVEVNVVLDDFTKAAITASGNTSLTKIQKSALETFFRKLGAIGNESAIWSKMKYVFMPMLAGGIANSMVNYVDNVALTVDSEKFALRSKGITGATSTKYYISGTLSSGISLQDMSGFIMAMEAQENAEIPAFCLSPSDTSKRMSLYYAKTGANKMNLCATYPSSLNANFEFNGDMTSASAKNLGGISVDGTTVRQLKSSGTISSPTVAIPEVTTGTDVRWLATVGSVGVNSDTPSIGLVMLGSKLTAEEMSVLKEACETLRGVLIA